MYQPLAWYVTVLLVTAVLIVFAWVAWQAGEREEYASLQRRSARIRTGVFWGLVLLFTPIIVVSLVELPYSPPAERAGVSQIIRATGQQWSWSLSSRNVVAGRPVEFHVTSADVNHGLGIYDPQLRLVAQTQAMPGYTNVLHYTFTEPGTYRLLCLEYCGVAHHNMITELTVTGEPHGGQDGD